MILLEKWKILTPLQCGQFGQNNCCHWLWKVAQSAINRPIWSHSVRATCKFKVAASSSDIELFKLKSFHLFGITFEIDLLLKWLSNNNYFSVVVNFTFKNHFPTTSINNTNFTLQKQIYLWPLLFYLRPYLFTFDHSKLPLTNLFYLWTFSGKFCITLTNNGVKNCLSLVVPFSLKQLMFCSDKRLVLTEVQKYGIGMLIKKLMPLGYRVRPI